MPILITSPSFSISTFEPVMKLLHLHLSSHSECNHFLFSVFHFLTLAASFLSPLDPLLSTNASRSVHVRHIPNGIVEHQHYTICGPSMKICKGNAFKWPMHAPHVFWANRITTQKSTGLSPFSSSSVRCHDHPECYRAPQSTRVPQSARAPQSATERQSTTIGISKAFK
jgi:hypothetical protein